MGTWTVRTGDGETAFDDRVAALTHAYVRHAATGTGGHLDGPDEPACATNRDLYLRLLDEGRRLRVQALDLPTFLHGWWLVTRPLAQRTSLHPDELAALIAAAGQVRPGPPDPRWRTASFDYAEEPDTFAAWEAIVLSQIADLTDIFAAGPLDPQAYFGLDAPRPDHSRRATLPRWYNFTVGSYLECAAAGTLGGWTEDDGTRVPVPGEVVNLFDEPAPGIHPLPPHLGWDVLCELARCGQEYE